MKGSRAQLATARVALVHDWLTGMRGGEKVLAELAELFPTAPIHTLFHFPGSVDAALERHPIHTSFLQGWPGIRRHYRSYLPMFPAAIEDLDLDGCDLVVSSSHCVAKGVRPPPGALHLCYCHTPMRYAWDQERTYFPRRTGLFARLRGLVLTGLRSWDTATVPRVDRFVANSRFVARRIRRFYGREAEVVPPPVDVERFTRAAGDAERGAYALVVAALAPYKRTEVAIAACAAAGIELRVVGDGPQRRRLEQLGVAGTRFLGRVDGDELRRLYRGAKLFVQPQIEDFGIAAVEALAAGTPVVAVGHGGICDIVEEGVHGLLCETASDTTTAAAALAATIDKARRIRFNGLELQRRASDFARPVFRERIRSVLSRLFEELEASRT